SLVTQQSLGRRRWLKSAKIVASVLGLAMGVVVLLVLTGIIAEPETAIESVVRALFGK
ncbi:MAG: hypothetical protein GX630_09670, partial [Actinobacteria bacterium]|nr:hypothetical protein [Actinomycetota bacterium]